MTGHPPRGAAPHPDATPRGYTMPEGVRAVPEQAARLLPYFAYAHLPPHLAEVSRPFAELAEHLATRLDGPELTAGLRKLLEAKDCCVRAAL